MKNSVRVPVKKDSTRELERRIEKLERSLQEMRRMHSNEMRAVNESFRTYKDIMLKMHEERIMKTEKSMANAKIEEELEQRVLNPVKIAVRENIDFIKKAAKEDLTADMRAHEEYEDYESAAKKKAEKV